MRYYDLVLSDPNSGLVFKPDTDPRRGFTKSPGGSTFTSWVKGPLGMQTDPGALQIDFDMPVTAAHEPQGKHWIRMSGVSLAMIGSASDLNGQAFKLSGGMKPGLPLATAQSVQSGLLASGTIYQAYGNWEGTSQTLDLICSPGGIVPEQGVMFDWQPNMSLKTTLETSFAQAFPQYTPDIHISPLYKVQAQEAGCYEDLTTFAQYINERTTAMGKQLFGRQEFQGVSILLSGTRIVVFDQTTLAKTTQLAFTDLMGQPTWIEPNKISFKCVLRADISVGDYIQFPEGIFPPYVLTTAGAASPGAPSRSSLVFKGKFKVNEVHHYGSSRSPDAQAWNTAFVASAIPYPDVNLLNSTVAL